MHALAKREPTKFLANQAQKGLILCYTGASLEADANGNKIGWAGGFYIFCRQHGRPSGALRYSFSCELGNPGMGIGGLEAPALLAAWKRLPAGVREFFRLACAIDNTSVLYCTSKTFSANLTVTAVVALVLGEIGEDTSFFNAPSLLNLADIMTRPKRLGGICDSVFLEKAHTNTQGIAAILRDTESKISEVSQYTWRSNSGKGARGRKR